MPLAAHTCINWAAPAVCGSATPRVRAPELMANHTVAPDTDIATNG